jgi:hypothetical protein
MTKGNDWETIIERIERRVGDQGILIAQERADVINRKISKMLSPSDK